MGTRDHPDAFSEPQITVVVHRSRRPLPGRKARAALVVAALGVVIGGAVIGGAVIGVAAITGVAGGGSPRVSSVPGAGGSFGYPFRCLSVAFAPNGAGVAHAYVQHGGLCRRYGKYVSATFHRVDGAWQVVTDVDDVQAMRR
jgi:hypothetical protein